MRGQSFPFSRAFSLGLAAAALAAACGDGPDYSHARRTGQSSGSSGASSGATSSGDPSTTTSSSGASGTSGGSSGTSGTSSGAGLTCTSCHGDANRVGVAGADPSVTIAPPRGSKGETASSARAVGAHQAHLTKAAGAISKPIACAECHVLPTSTGHSDGTVQITFGALAKTGNANPTWNGTTCTTAYCHGSFTGGDNAAAPVWTGAAMTCTSCHAAPPSTGDHRRGPHLQVPCSDCHGAGYTSTTVNAALHVNGVKNVGGAGSKINTWDANTRSCTPQCHGRETW